MISLKIAFVASLLIASIVDQAYSTACFTCVHNSVDGNKTIACVNKPAQLRFVKPCSTDSGLATGEATGEATGGLLPFANTDSDTKYKCITLNITDEKQFSFQRSCLPSYITCDIVKNSLQNGVKLDTCRMCDGDLCNASSKAGIAIFTLISCLITSYVIFN